jgi:hypothetical protein
MRNKTLVHGTNHDYNKGTNIYDHITNQGNKNLGPHKFSLLHNPKFCFLCTHDFLLQRNIRSKGENFKRVEQKKLHGTNYRLITNL